MWSMPPGAAYDLSLRHGLTGLASVSKPPPLNMVNTISRSTATLPTGGNHVSPPGNNTAAALNATRQSSFAAALRKLAKQAEGPEGLPSHLDSNRDPSPSNSSPRDLTPKRAPPNFGYSHATSPPEGATAQHPAYKDRKNVERGPISNDGIKQERERLTPLSHDRRGESHDRRTESHDRRDRETPSGKDVNHNSSSRQSSSSSTSTSMASSSEDPLRGFQPYRAAGGGSGEESGRTPVIPPFPGFDPAMYLHHPALQQQAAAFMPPGLRLDDPLYERYRMMQAVASAAPPGYGYPHPSMFSPGAAGMLPFPGGIRYPSELMDPRYPFLPPTSLAEHISPGVDRAKSEDQIRREQEAERNREREKELERQREKEREEKEKQERERREREKMEKERMERERLERARMHMDQKSPSSKYRDKPPGLPHPGAHPAAYPAHMHGLGRDSLYSAERYLGNSYAPQQTDPLPLNLKKEDNTRSMYSSRERDLQQLHQEFVKEQDKAVKSESRDKVHHPSGIPQISAIPKVTAHAPRTSESHSFHRPFEGSHPGDPTLHLNGTIQQNHYAEYERKLKLERERLLAQDSKLGERLLAENAKLNADRNKTAALNLNSHHSVSHKSKDSVQVQKGQQESSANSRLLNSDKHLNHHSNHLQLFPGYQGLYNNHSLPPHVNHNEAEAQRKHSDIIKKDSTKPEGDSTGIPLPQNMGIPRVPPMHPLLGKAEAADVRVNGALHRADDRKAERLLMDAEKERLKHKHDMLVESSYDKHSKRRRLYADPIVEDPVPAPLTTRYHPDDMLREPDVKQKMRFLHTLGLDALTPEKRNHLEVLRQVCDWDRKRRDNVRKQQILTSDKPSTNHSHTSFTSSPLKRKLTEKDTANNTNPSQRPKHHSLKPSSNDKRPVIFPKSALDQEFSRSFAAEFHQSVLQTTRQQQQQHSGESLKQANDEGSASVGMFKWPGVEMVMEAYQKHIQETNMEEEILKDQCRRLQSSHKELAVMVETLSNKKKELLKAKQQLDAERVRHQTALDDLKKHVNAVR